MNTVDKEESRETLMRKGALSYSIEDVVFDDKVLIRRRDD